MKRRKLLTGVTALIAATPFAPLITACKPAAVDPQQWRQTFPGTVVLESDRYYEEWRSGMAWQMYVHDRRPALIVRPQGVTGIQAALRFAKEQRLKVAMKSGGHNVSGAFLRQGGMLLDLGEFSGVEIDAEQGTAWVGPALWCRNLALALEPKGFAFPYAHCATVPLGGYLLGGGVGINGDEWGGMACHSVIGAELILADGTVKQVSATGDPELFWAVRGGGTGFFGVVSRYQIHLYPLPGTIRTSVFIFPLQQAPAIAAWLDENIDSRNSKTETMMLLAHNPMAPKNATGAEAKVCIARIAVFADSPAQAAELLDPWHNDLQAAGALMALKDQAATFESMFIESVDATAGLGFGCYDVETIWSDDPSATIASLLDSFAHAPSAKSHILLSPRNIRNRLAESAFSRIGRAFVGCYSVWDEVADSAANFAFTQKVVTDMQPTTRGRYINEIDAFTYPDRVHEAYSASAWNRLADLRAKYDPGGLFADFPGQQHVQTL